MASCKHCLCIKKRQNLLRSYLLIKPYIYTTTECNFRSIDTVRKLIVFFNLFFLILIFVTFFFLFFRDFTSLESVALPFKNSKTFAEYLSFACRFIPKCLGKNSIYSPDIDRSYLYHEILRNSYD